MARDGKRAEGTRILWAELTGEMCIRDRCIPIIVGLLLGACYDDLGNYNSKEINELTVVLPEVVEVVVANKDSVKVVLRPEVKQSAREDNGNLTYLWRQKEVSGSSAVSYTHLDVYKRQCIIL